MLSKEILDEVEGISKAVYYAKIILDDVLVKQALSDKGALGSYVYEMIEGTMKYAR